MRQALDLGINYVDTAPAYETEEIVGRALIGRRDQVVLSTKAAPRTERGLITPDELRAALQRSLRRLRCDTVDVFHLHGVTLAEHVYCLDALVPEMERMRDDGLLRFLAISEQFTTDPSHQLLERVVGDGCWDALMVGFNLLNPSARRAVLPGAIAADLGVEVMFAARPLLSRPLEMATVVRQWVNAGLVPHEAVDMDNPLGFLVRRHGGSAGSIVEAAYRFARHEPGCHVVLTGTGSASHLEENVRAIGGPPLPTADRQRLALLFAHVAAD